MYPCIICNADLSNLSELDQITHIDACIDSKLEPQISIETQLSDSQFERNYFAMSYEPTDFYEEKEPIRETIQKFEEQKIETANEIEIDTTGMPDYSKMSVNEIKVELDKYGMKKNLDIKSSREILKQTWLYLNRGIFPKFYDKYLK